MTRRTTLVWFAAGLVALSVVASACDLSLPVDCSGINQPDNGGLVCLGLNGVALNAIAALVALVLGALGAGA